jgi:hypothetical protein
MSHDVGVWIDHKKAIIVSIAAGILLVSLMFVEVDPNLKESITLALKEAGTNATNGGPFAEDGMARMRHCPSRQV